MLLIMLLNLSILNGTFFSTVIRSRFQANTARSPRHPRCYLSLLLYVTQYHSGFLFLLDVGSGFSRSRNLFLYALFNLYDLASNKSYVCLDPQCKSVQARLNTE